MQTPYILLDARAPIDPDGNFVYVYRKYLKIRYSRAPINIQWMLWVWSWILKSLMPSREGLYSGNNLSFLLKKKSKLKLLYSFLDSSIYIFSLLTFYLYFFVVFPLSYLVYFITSYKLLEVSWLATLCFLYSFWTLLFIPFHCWPFTYIFFCFSTFLFIVFHLLTISFLG